MLHSNPRQGFTLRELMVVMAIISLLMGLLLPYVQLARERARRDDCAENMHQVALALQRYHSTYNTLPPASICSFHDQPVTAHGPDDLADTQWGPTAHVLLQPYLDAGPIVVGKSSSTGGWALWGDLRAEDANGQNAGDARIPTGCDDRPATEYIKKYQCPSSPRARTTRPLAPSLGTLVGCYAKGNVALNGGAGFAYSYDTDRTNYGNGSWRWKGPFGVHAQYGATYGEMADGASYTVVCSEILTYDDAEDGRGCWARVGCSLFSAHTAATGLEFICTPNIRTTDGRGKPLVWAQDHPIFCSPNADGDLACGNWTAPTGFVGYGRNVMARGSGGGGGVAVRSHHPHGVNASMADASVRWVVDEVDAIIWRNGNSIDGKEPNTIDQEAH